MLVGLIFPLVQKLNGSKKIWGRFDLAIFIWVGPTKKNEEEMVRNRTRPDEMRQSEVDGGVSFITVHE